MPNQTVSTSFFFNSSAKQCQGRHGRRAACHNHDFFMRLVPLRQLAVHLPVRALDGFHNRPATPSHRDRQNQHTRPAITHKGKVKPLVGKSPKFTPILIMACRTIQSQRHRRSGRRKFGFSNACVRYGTTIQITRYNKSKGHTNQAKLFCINGK